MSTAPNNLKKNTANAAAIAGVFLFFGVGTAIAWCLAFDFLAQGHSLFPSIFLAASAGGFGAWAIFAIGFHAIHLIKRLSVAKNHEDSP
jgi:hypothetical protein